MRTTGMHPSRLLRPRVLIEAHIVFQSDQTSPFQDITDGLTSPQTRCRTAEIRENHESPAVRETQGNLGILEIIGTRETHRGILDSQSLLDPNVVVISPIKINAGQILNPENPAAFQRKIGLPGRTRCLSAATKEPTSVTTAPLATDQHRQTDALLSLAGFRENPLPPRRRHRPLKIPPRTRQ